MKNDRRKNHRPKWSALMHGFWAAFSGAVLVGISGLFGGVSEQLTTLGILVSSVMGLQLGQLESQKRQQRQVERLVELGSLQSSLLERPDLLSVHVRIARSLNSLAESENATLRDHAIASLSDLHAKISEMSEGKLVFENTETWRTVYERLLKKPEVTYYRSVSWFRNEGYWQDLPGKKSLRLNCELAESGLLIHRTVIAPDALWANSEQLPRQPLLDWINEQHLHGIWINLVRENDIIQEPLLLVDLGIYGDVAVGTQLVDEKGQTSRFEIDFRADEREWAEEIWERLSLFATSYVELLERNRKLP